MSSDLLGTVSERLGCDLQGVAARQFDAWDLGMVSSDDFGNADVRYEQSFANIRASLTQSNGGPPEIPIVTGFLARGESTGRYLTASCLPHNTPWHNTPWHNIPWHKIPWQKRSKCHVHVLCGISHSQDIYTWLQVIKVREKLALALMIHRQQAMMIQVTL